MTQVANAPTTLTMDEFLGSIESGEKFACPTHQGRRKGTFGVNGAKRHISWCTDMQTAYAVTSATKAPKAKAKPSVYEDSAIRGWASKPRTVRRDARQVEKPVGRQDNSVRSVGRVRVTGGYVDPATISETGWDVDKNGNALKGKALTNRVEKLVRNGKAVVQVTPPTEAPAEVATERPAVGTITQDALYDVHKRLLALEVEVTNFAPVVQALQSYVDAHEDMIDNPAS